MDRSILMQELDWFRAEVPSWPWKWATTFEGGAEHAYVIKGHHLDATTYERAARIIHGAGAPRRYYRRLNIELHLPELEVPYGREPLGSRPVQHGVKFWLMSHRTSVSKALNIAPVTAEYGRQDAPSTATADVSPWDLNALDYDDAFERAGLAVMGEPLRRAVGSGGATAPVLDLGARAGAALDLGLATTEGEYTAVEPSRGLMHSLLFKHGRARDVHVQSAEDYLSTHQASNLDTVVALFGAASDLRPQHIRELAGKSRRLVLMHHLEDPSEDFFGPTHLPHWAAASREAARALPDAQCEHLGDYLLTVV